MTTADPPTPRGWFDRLLDLGNHNRIIAAATLVTLATGVPYLVVTAVRAVAGDDTLATTRGVLDEALRDALAQVDSAAGRIAVQRDSDASDVVADATGALQALQADALRPEATPEEVERVTEAFRRFGQGESAAALAEFERIAVGQERRGAIEAAADSWRSRASLQLLSAPAEALEDLRRAEILAPGGVEDVLRQARLHRDLGEMQDAVALTRRALALARRGGDRRDLVLALVGFVECQDLGVYMDSEMVAEMEAAKVEIDGLLAELTSARPEDLVLLRMRPKFLQGVTPEERVAVLSELLAKLVALPRSAGTAADRLLAELELRTALVGARWNTGQVEPLAVEVDAALATADRLEAGAGVGPAQRPVVMDAMLMLAIAVDRLGDPERQVAVARRGVAVGEQMAAADPTSPRGLTRLRVALHGLATALILTGRADEAILELERSMELSEQAVARYEDTQSGWGEHVLSVFSCAIRLPESHAEQAIAWLDQAQEVVDRELVDPDQAQNRMMRTLLIGKEREKRMGQIAGRGGDGPSAQPPTGGG